ncbi:branched-chain amino acid transport system II carrier protein [Vandammella animalimorsus]|uniref:branched-chain amino acid transport system II carrier protein n=1 Tax=Vandammella animalimorsus TaxID=2029117 RepID=UPI0031BB25C2
MPSAGQRLSLSLLMATGMMLFALFFGAGNLIFPAALGQQAGQSLWPAIWGFLITGVGLPLLGVLALGLSRAQGLQDLASRVHPWFGVLFTVALYLTIGPLFALPRTGSVAFEIGLSPWLPQQGRKLWEIGSLALFFAIALWLALSPGKLVGRIGKVLTPLLLLAMALLIASTFIAPMGPPAAAQAAYQAQPFVKGFLAGYDTMDALASLVFGMLVLMSVHQAGIREPAQIMRATFAAGLVAALLLAVVYVCIARMGATSLAQLGLLDNGAKVLSGVAMHYYGAWGAVLLGVMVFLACVTTAVGLLAACAAYFNHLWPILNYRALVLLFALVSFAIASLGLGTILSAAVPVLVFLYPLTIVLIVLAMGQALLGWGAVVWRWAMGATVLSALLHALHSAKWLPAALADGLARYVPGQEAGLGWMVFAAAGLALGLLHWQATGRKPMQLA